MDVAVYFFRVGPNLIIFLNESTFTRREKMVLVTKSVRTDHKSSRVTFKPVLI